MDIADGINNNILGHLRRPKMCLNPAGTLTKTTG